MAYGLRIDNGTGQRVVDSEYRGVRYLGRRTVSGTDSFSLPSYSGDTPPVVFIKPPTSGISTIAAIRNATGSKPGGVDTTVPSSYTLSLAPSTVKYVYWNSAGGPFGEGDFLTDASACSALGGTISGGRCVRTSDLTLDVDSYVRNVSSGTTGNLRAVSHNSVTAGTSTSLVLDQGFGTLGNLVSIRGEGYVYDTPTFDLTTYPPTPQSGRLVKFSWNGVSASGSSATLSNVKWWNESGTQLISGDPFFGQSFSSHADLRGNTYTTGNATFTFNSLGVMTGGTLNSANVGYSTDSADNVPRTVGSTGTAIGYNAAVFGDDVNTIRVQNSSYDGFVPNSSGFYPYVVSSGKFVIDFGYSESNLPRLSLTPGAALKEGWIVDVEGDATSTIYVFASGDIPPAADDYGLELRNSSGELTFTSTLPPLNIKDVQTVQLNGWSYENTTTGSVTGNFDTSNTAITSLPVNTPLLSKYDIENFVPPISIPYPTVDPSPQNISYGFRWQVSGSTITGLTSSFVSTDGVLGGTISLASFIDLNNNNQLPPPVWGLQSGNHPDFYNSTTPLVGDSLPPDPTFPTLDLEGEVIFLDTTVYDRSEFDYLDFT